MAAVPEPLGRSHVTDVAEKAFSIGTLNSCSLFLKKIVHNFSGALMTFKLVSVEIINIEQKTLKMCYLQVDGDVIYMYL